MALSESLGLTQESKGLPRLSETYRNPAYKWCKQAPGEYSVYSPMSHSAT